jgi:hypothetical protein
MAREVRLVKALADEGFKYDRNGGVDPIPRDRMITFTALPLHIGKVLARQIEAGGVPALLLRGGGQRNPDGVLDYDVIVPATTEAYVRERFSDARDAALAEAEAWRRTFPRS